MNKNANSPLVDWDPELGAAGKAYADEVERQVRRRVMLVRSARRALGFSQIELAGLLGLTQSAISKMETREDTIIDVLEKMAEARGRTLRISFERDDAPLVSVGMS